MDRRKGSGHGLYHLRARQYDPAVGRFLSLDPLEPAATMPVMSAYGYVEARPTAAVDPSGMRTVGVRSGVRWTLRATSPVLARRPKGTGTCLARAARLDCEPADFDAANWDQRIGWLSAFQRRYSTDGWFNNIDGVLRYFRQSPTFSRSDWASVSDAYVLWTIQAGLERFLTRKSDVPWSRFFRPLRRPNSSEALLRTRWGVAEQSSINFALDIADAQGFGPEGDESELARIFVFIGNIYRAKVKLNSWLWAPCARSFGFETTAQADPRRDANLVYQNARQLESLYNVGGAAVLLGVAACLAPG